MYRSQRDGPGRDKVVQVSHLVETRDIGQDDELSLTTAQLAWIIDQNQMDRDHNVLAAVAYLVHANLESGPDAASNVAQLIRDVSSGIPVIDRHARNMAMLARDSGVHSYESAQGQGAGQVEGVIENIGLRANNGGWIADRHFTATLSGRIVFKETGTQEYSGVTQSGPITLEWKSTGNGEARVTTRYEMPRDEIIAKLVTGS